MVSRIVTARGAQSLTWDVENRMTGVTGSASFVYDGNGFRVKKTESGQTIVTLSSSDEAAFRRALRQLIDTYRCPRNTPGRWGSNERGEEIAQELMEAFDGWD